MKKLILLSFITTIASGLQAQLVITPNQTASYLANKLVATSGTLGVNVSNAVLNCDTNANGEFTGTSNLGIADGIALGTGNVASDTSLSLFGLNGLPLDFASTSNNFPGDTQLDGIVGTTTYDACVLEFDLQPVGTFVEFEYVFGSEEYPEFNCSAFNDIFGFFISGPGFSTPTNIALIPSSTTPVSINTINDGTGLCTPPANTALYVTNTDTTCTMDGFTLPLIATANVTSGATYHLKMVIADASDGILNSYVILKANSLKSGNSTPNSLQTITKESGLSVFPTLVEENFTIENKLHESWDVRISDMNGRNLYHTGISANQTNNIICMDTFSKGIYLLRLKRNSDGKVFVEKLIKE